jgi:hypothetical protein
LKKLGDSDKKKNHGPCAMESGHIRGIQKAQCPNHEYHCGTHELPVTSARIDRPGSSEQAVVAGKEPGPQAHQKHGPEFVKAVLKQSGRVKQEKRAEQNEDDRAGGYLG